jgi:hypothetical protein
MSTFGSACHFKSVCMLTRGGCPSWQLLLELVEAGHADEDGLHGHDLPQDTQAQAQVRGHTNQGPREEQ